jgi:methylated-DNA-[protein]-cysteine S-methyltransferase
MDEEAGIYARESTYLDCHVQVGVAQGRVISASFPPVPDADAESDHGLLDRIAAYLRGDRDDFSDVTVALTMATDERAVLERVREIPYGEQATVEQLARMVPGRDPGEPEDRTLVREALASNPVPLLVPDHRVQNGPGGASAAVEQKLRAVEDL